MGKQITVETPLVGRHQLRNVALAIAAAEQLSQQGFATISAAAIERGIRETHWPGRFQCSLPAPTIPKSYSTSPTIRRGMGAPFDPLRTL